jgi:acetolactate synthase I/II/III large subunit
MSNEMNSPDLQVTAACKLLLEAARSGVEFIFTNLGSDHPAFIEAFATLAASNERMPEIIICPHEMTALSAAHGHALVSRRAQMVLVHVDVGTQNLGGSVHNAARSRVPAIIVAGLSPVSTNGERLGSRTEFIHYTQDTTRQHEIVAQYMKWCYEVRDAEMTDQVLLRGLQIAQTEPQGPIYLTGAREVWEETTQAPPQTLTNWRPSQQAGINPEDLANFDKALCAAKRPLIVTSYLGRQTESVKRLVELADQIGIAVCEVNPQYVNFPGDHPMHIGYRRNTLIDEADLIWMLDVDVPWIMSKVQPASATRIFHLDIDTLKASMGFWHFPAEQSWQADSLTVLNQLVGMPRHIDENARTQRIEWIQSSQAKLAMPDLPTPGNDAINIQQLSNAIAQLVNDQTVVAFEAPTATDRILDALRMRRPGSYFANGGSGLGWSINAAIGIKLAQPEADVITIVGDGSYVFGVPSSTYWVAATYQVPQLTIVINNGGWNAPKASTLLVHPQGRALKSDQFWITSTRNSRLADIAAAAGGAHAFRVSNFSELASTLEQAIKTVRQGQTCVVEVMTLPISAQVLGHKNETSL